MSGDDRYIHLASLSSMAQLQESKRMLRRDLKRSAESIQQEARNKIDSVRGMLDGFTGGKRRSGYRSESTCSCGCGCSGDCDCGCQSGHECTCGQRSSRTDSVLGLLGNIGGVSGIISSALLGYRLVRGIVESRRRRKASKANRADMGDELIIIEEF